LSSVAVHRAALADTTYFFFKNSVMIFNIVPYIQGKAGHSYKSENENNHTKGLFTPLVCPLFFPPLEECRLLFLLFQKTPKLHSLRLYLLKNQHGAQVPLKIGKTAGNMVVLADIPRFQY
jgi:hypothetical protein